MSLPRPPPHGEDEEERYKAAFLPAFPLAAPRAGKVFRLNFVFILRATPAAAAAAAALQSRRREADGVGRDVLPSLELQYLPV